MKTLTGDAPVRFRCSWISGLSARKNGLVSRSNSKVEGMVGSPFACLSSMSLIRNISAGLAGSTVVAKEALLAVYSWPE